MYLEAAALVTGEVMHANGGRNVALWALGGNEPLAVFRPVCGEIRLRGAPDNLCSRYVLSELVVSRFGIACLSKIIGPFSAERGQVDGENVDSKNRESRLTGGRQTKKRPMTTTFGS